MDYVQNFYKGKRVLVTGGAGFIGSHLVERLVEYGARVSVIDNFSTGSINNLKNVVAEVTIFYADICSGHSVVKATQNQDIVFHLAALTSVPASVENPELCSKINVQGMQQLLEACVKNGVASFVFSSSSAVYGNRSTPCREDDEPQPESPYAQSKLMGEVLCKKYAEQSSLKATVLRYFNVFGPRQSPTSPYAAVVATFTDRLLNGKPITIFGDGMQTRDFINVSDVVAANLTVGRVECSKGEVFNIGTGKSINLLELIDHLEKTLKVRRADVLFQPARRGDIVHSSACCDKYKRLVECICQQ